MVQHMKSNVRRQIELPYQDNPSLKEEESQRESPPSLSRHDQQPLTTRRPQDEYTIERRAANESSSDLPTAQPYHLLPIGEVMKIVGMKRTTIYQMIKADAFPAPLKLGGASRWVDTEIYLWIASLIKQRDLSAHRSRA
jgi:prophage regulatory protein